MRQKTSSPYNPTMHEDSSWKCPTKGIPAGPRARSSSTTAIVLMTAQSIFNPCMHAGLRQTHMFSCIGGATNEHGYNRKLEPSIAVVALDTSTDVAPRADALFTSDGMSLLIDVSVVCSVLPSYRDKCVKQASAPMTYRAGIKYSLYGRVAATLGHSFSPVIIDALGVPHISTVNTIRSLADAAISSHRLCVSARPFFIVAALSRLAFATAAGNQLMISSCCLPFVPASSCPADTLPSAFAPSGRLRDDLVAFF